MFSLDDLNRSHLEHTVIAATIQLQLTAFFLWVSGSLPFILIAAAALPGCFLFFGREHAQQERLLKKLPGMTERQAVIAAMNFFQWDTDSQLDFLCPVCSAVIQAILWIIVMIL